MAGGSNDTSNKDNKILLINYPKHPKGTLVKSPQIVHTPFYDHFVFYCRVVAAHVHEQFFVSSGSWPVDGARVPFRHSFQKNP